MAAAARLLESRSRSVADLRTRLARAGWPAAFVDQALERLADIGLLDDEAYARLVKMHSDRRQTSEASEGLASFAEKRAARWGNV